MNRNGRIPNNKDIAMYGQSYLYEKFARKYGVIPAQVDAITEISVIFPSVTINASKYEVIARTAIATNCVIGVMSLMKKFVCRKTARVSEM